MISLSSSWSEFYQWELSQEQQLCCGKTEKKGGAARVGKEEAQ